jgi:hypothetical protein
MISLSLAPFPPDCVLMIEEHMFMVDSFRKWITLPADLISTMIIYMMCRSQLQRQEIPELTLIVK